jgi:hypothetical protein
MKTTVLWFVTVCSVEVNGVPEKNITVCNSAYSCLIYPSILMMGTIYSSEISTEMLGGIRQKPALFSLS